MAPVNAPVPGPSSTTTRSAGASACTISRASARELGTTAPTVRGIAQKAPQQQKVLLEPRAVAAGAHRASSAGSGGADGLEQPLQRAGRPVQPRDLNALHARPQPLDDLVRDREPLGRRVGGASQPVEDRHRAFARRHLARQEFRLPQALERDDAGEHGQPGRGAADGLIASKASTSSTGGVTNELGAGLHLVIQPAPLRVGVGRERVRRRRQCGTASARLSAARRCRARG